MKNRDILYSVIVPAYNRRHYLEKLINRFANISYSNWELIIVDDGSVDDTRQFFENNFFNHVKYIHQENNERASARNRGLKVASGHYITFLDSDDYLVPDVFDVASNIVNANPGISIFHLGYEIRDVNDRIIRGSEILPDFLNNVLIERNVIACLGLFVERETALKFCFNEDRDLSGTEDYELWIRMAANMPIRHFNKTVAVLVEHEGRSMQEHNVNKMIRRIELFLHYTLMNPEIVNYLGKRKAKFIAFRYSYIALHAALAANKRLSFDFLIKAIGMYPILIFNKRVLVIVKKLIFR